MKVVISTERDRSYFIELIKQIELNGVWVGTFNKHRRRRSLSANGLYWMWLSVIEEATGCDKDDLHFWCASKFIGVEVKPVLGVEREVPLSTSTLDSKEFSAYMDTIKNYFLTKHGIILLAPGERGYDEMDATHG